MFIAIDFGTCNSVISYFFNNNIHHIIDETSGDVLIPSKLSFFDSLFSNPPSFIPSKTYSISHSSDSIFSFFQFKRFLGINKHSHPDSISFINKFNLNYELDDELIYFILSHNNISIKLSIIDIIKYYFIYLKSLILSQIYNNNNNNNNNINIILTAPAYFNDLQKTQLKKAVEYAGFTVFKLISEPTAAAIYYINHFINNNNNINDNNDNNKFIIYDLGGGTIDTTVVDYDYENNTCDIVDTYGNNSLGGIDIDNLIVKDIIERYKIKETPKNYIKLQKLAEDIKIKLSYSTNYSICFEDNDNVINISYSRVYFNNLINNLISDMISSLITLAKKYNSNNIIYIGGPTQIPLLKQKVNALLNINNNNNNNNFYNNNLYKIIVASGASYYYNIISNKKEFYLLDITPMNIGIKDANDNFVIMINKNSKIPCSSENIFSTTYDGQRSIDINIYEGTSNNINENKIIGSYKITNIPPLPKGNILIKLIFNINSFGILNVNIAGSKYTTDDDLSHYDFRLNDKIKIIPMSVARELLKKLFQK
jgi:molecular chaperone DnaK